jgi:hypothetical protein
MTYAEATTTADALSVGNAIRGILDPAGLTRLWPSEAPNTASANLPTVKSVSTVTYVDGAFGGSGSTINGAVKLTLTPASNDTVNASSPLMPMIPAKAVIITATG